MVKIGTILSRKWSKEPSWLAMCSVYIRNELPTGLPARFNDIQHKGDILPIRTCGDFYVSFVYRYCHEQSTCRIVPWLFRQSIILTIDNSTFACYDDPDHPVHTAGMLVIGNHAMCVGFSQLRQFSRPENPARNLYWVPGSKISKNAQP